MAMGSVLDVAIGVIFVYLVLSLLCTTINEGVATVLNQRGKNLFEGIKNLLNDPTLTGLAQQLYSHGLVDSLSRGAMSAKPKRPPSYLPAKTFAVALLDILGAQGVAAAAHGALLREAEAAFVTWQRAISARESADTVEKKRQASDAATRALAQAAADADARLGVVIAATPKDPAAIAGAKNAVDTADAAVKMFGARRAALALASGPKSAAAVGAASDALEAALAAGRALAATAPDRLQVVGAAAAFLPAGHTRESLLVLIDQTRRAVPKVEHQFDHLRAGIEGWFNDAMDRVGGWYKRWTQALLLVIASTLCVALNVDTILLIGEISGSGDTRAALVAAAQRSSAAPPGSGESANLSSLSSLSSLSLGWSLSATDARRFPWEMSPVTTTKDPGGAFHPDVRDPGLALAGAWILKVLGLLVSIGAVSLGAPFWFDLLSKVINLRGAGTPPGETSKSAGRKRTSEG
jgi:hypothetical protein